MNLSYHELLELIQNGTVEGSDTKYLNAASIDITLGPTLMVEVPSNFGLRERSLATLEPLLMQEVDCTEGYSLKPGQFVLAHSREKFNLPDNLVAEYHLKSSMARIGLNHMKAGWCDPGWHGSVLTLELHNVTQHHAIRIKAGDRIGQMEFRRVYPVPNEASYRTKGRYNNDLTVQPPKARRE